MASWFAVDRKLFDHWIWKSKEPFDKRSAWIDLVGMAAYKSHSGDTYDGKFDVIKRGEIHTSMLYLSKRWKWDRRKVKRFLSSLSDDGMVSFNSTTNGTTGGTVITIENYALYQDVGTKHSTTDGMYHSTTDAHIRTKETSNSIYNNGPGGLKYGQRYIDPETGLPRIKVR